MGSTSLSLVLRATIEKLFEKRVVLDFTDHLSDYQLYGLIFRDILPSHEKKLERRTSYLHWDCANIEENPDIWLRYYASPAERQMWAEENDQPCRRTTSRRSAAKCRGRRFSFGVAAALQHLWPHGIADEQAFARELNLLAVIA